MQVAGDDKSVRDAVSVPGIVLPVEHDEQLAKRIAARGTAAWLNGLTSSIANSRHHASIDLSEARVSDKKASVDEQMLP